MVKGERIKEKRKLFKMTQEELAQKLSTTKQTIYKYETGEITNIPSDKIELMAQLFNTTPSYLMGWDNVDFSDNDNEQYYHDKEVARIAEELKDNPGKRVLFDAMRDISEEDMLLLKKLIDKMTKQD